MESILLAGYDPEVLKKFQEMLKAKCRVVIARDLAELAETSGKEFFQLVLVDAGCLGSANVEILRLAKLIHKQKRVIVLVKDILQGDLLKQSHKGLFTGFVCKIFSEEIILCLLCEELKNINCS